MASQIDEHVFTDPDGHEVFVALLGRRPLAQAPHEVGPGRPQYLIGTQVSRLEADHGMTPVVHQVRNGPVAPRLGGPGQLLMEPVAGAASA